MSFMHLHLGNQHRHQRTSFDWNDDDDKPQSQSRSQSPEQHNHDHDHDQQYCNETEEMIQQAQILAEEDAPLDANILFLQALGRQEGRYGHYSDEAARLYYIMAWHFYHNQLQQQNNEENEEDGNTSNGPALLLALAYFLQCLRISHTLHGEEAATTQAILDDVQDILEELKLDDEYIHRVFDSWALQDDAADLLRASSASDDDHTSSSTSSFASSFASSSTAVQEEVQNIYQDALHRIPHELDWERATVVLPLAELAHEQQQTEQALSGYCQAIMTLSRYLSGDHPSIVALQEQSHQVVAQLTPIRPTTIQRSTSWWKRSYQYRGRQSSTFACSE